MRVPPTVRHATVPLPCASVVLACLLAWPRPALAAAGDRPPATAPLHGFSHVAWAVEQGAPGDIWDMAQARDGSLWLATGGGLYRFDGRGFQRYEPPSGEAFASSNLTTLDIGPHGDLWLGTYNAGIGRIAGGHLLDYGPAQGVPAGLVPRIASDADGRTWAAVDGGLRWFDGRRWQLPAASSGGPSGRAHWVMSDRRGTLWVAGDHVLWRMPRGTGRFDAVPALRLASFASLAEAPDGSVWLADRAGGLMPVSDAAGRLLDAGRRAARTVPLKAGRIRFFDDGSLWASLLGGGGLARVVFSDDGKAVRIGRFDVADGLPSTFASALLRDREGNLWVGTNQGLSRFRPHVVHLMPALPGTGRENLYTLYRADDGTVHAYGDDMRPWRLGRPGTSGAGDAAMPFAPSTQATVWTAYHGAMARWRNGHVQPVPLPVSDEALRYLHAMAFDGDRAWACLAQAGVLRFDGGVWHGEPRLPKSPCSVVTAADAAWFGYPDGRVRSLDGGGRVRTFGVGDGLAVGPVTGIHVTQRWVLVAGETGLALREGDGRFLRVSASRVDLLDGINGMALDGSGQVWLYGIRGLLRVAEDDLLRSAREQVPLRNPRLFDAIDGLPGLSRQASPVPTAMLDRDGVLWLSSNHGLAWLDTVGLKRNPIPPQVVLGAVQAGGHPWPLVDGLVLPKRTTQLDIGYSAVSLARPERVRYRYRLEGLEQAWHEAGNQTRATYANLAPGRYRFEVMAANEDGLWTPQPATADFRIAPALVQTLPFKLTCIVAVIALLVLVVRLRSRRLAARFRDRLEERHRERERIARDLHDTLLQGTQGLVLRLHAASLKLAPGEPVRAELERAMDLAEDVLKEGRERVKGLREPYPKSRELGEVLLQTGQAIPAARRPELRLVREGRPRPLQSCTGEELFLIGREAMANAFRHAMADAVEIEIGYGPRELTLRVRDDGHGLPAGVVAADGHFGLQGMRERAARAGGSLQLWSRPGLGTEVAVSVPSRRAYLQVRGARSFWPFRRVPDSGAGRS